MQRRRGHECAVPTRLAAQHCAGAVWTDQAPQRGPVVALVTTGFWQLVAGSIGGRGSLRRQPTTGVAPGSLDPRRAALAGPR